MITKTINFTCYEQDLVLDGEAEEYASNTVNYIEAVFELLDGWEDLDSVRAIWRNRGNVVACVLDHNTCKVPAEVLRETGFVKVNLVGSAFENGELTDRITSCPVIALVVTKAALVDDGSAITPTEFEQFVARVEAAAAKSTIEH